MLAQMALFVVRDSILPKPPGDLEPAIGQTAIGMAERVAVRSNGLEIGIGPDGGVDRAFRPLLNDGAELMITGATEEDDLVFSTGPGDRAGSGDGLENLRGGETGTIITELGQERWSQYFSGSRQRGEDRIVRMLKE